MTAEQLTLERHAYMNLASAQYAICQTPPWTRNICYIALTRNRPTSAQQHHQTLLGCHSDDQKTSPTPAIGTTKNNILKPTDTTFTVGMMNYTVAVNHTVIKR